MKNSLKRFLPLAGAVLALALQLLIKNHRRHPAALHPYYAELLVIFAVLALLAFAASFFLKKMKFFLEKNGPVITASFVLLSALNVLTAKTAILPVMLFPSFDNILSVFVESRGLMAKCVLHSVKLLFTGIFFGVLVGFLTGVGLGFSRRFNYWVNPFIKIIGPIPATAWIPIALVVFPGTFGASVFIVALSVWFPVLLLTSSGIQNVPNAYFEVGKTLGAGRFYQIFRIAIPAALPNIFQGLFFGICSSFIALMTAEMFGAKAGIGWFINMEKELAEFKGVYAGLILIAVFCSVILKILFLAKDKTLRWQKGLVK